ncbi:hypothetical protein NWP22_16725 [Anabaenopsis tanganyikae CS-531]|uniref:Transposase n=1 Tax=Anabaenopsis tanganyikae CS-531 TaxID=2785304 RepID=A0ABT6KIG0_9CYAN|nr:MULTISPECIES: hypothetical protein [Anabaenopsis]MDH6091015.1 hypothetical protein [Anabaenopsis arnoldii]MDH6100007.1 hypothetical protein [Anabaenopsis sp. FSS-46]MDH6107483.1 hypothetical protein [Anabaenopsis tanganyikae CS-531]
MIPSNRLDVSGYYLAVSTLSRASIAFLSSQSRWRVFFLKELSQW